MIGELASFQAAGASAHRRRALSGAGVASLCALALLAASAPALAQSGRRPRGHDASLQSGKPPASATLEACQTAAGEAARSATFGGEMAAIPGTQRMQMSVQVLEWLAGETTYHVIAAPGLAGWRSSAPGVQSYKYLRQVTDLDAPAFYRATIRFRWLGAHGRTLALAELHTRRCEQPALPAGEASA